ncbi:MAG: CYTH domain-containing protein [Muribaculaceae bacterium]|nr:CYTH domain-containing protein [Muribaculaceae bacterium]
MAKEIERKFLVIDKSYREMAVTGRSIVQAYLNRDPKATVRVRITDDKAFLTIKGKNDGATRDEWEYPIPVSDARDMIARCASGRIIEKKRFVVPFEGYDWEIDEFGGELEGLTVAEIELPAEDAEFSLPPFVGDEVTGDPRYYNSSL